MRWFLDRAGVDARTRVLDVGGTSRMWPDAPLRPRLVFVNLARTRAEIAAGDELVIADGRALPFRDGAFEVVFSNSVIEHVGAPVEQRRFAAEIARVGRRYWVQTPNRFFPVEAHLLTPLVHWLPRRFQEWLVRRFTIWEMLARPRPDQRRYYIEHYLNDIRLLDAGGLAALFPDAVILRERFVGLTKSLIALRR